MLFGYCADEQEKWRVTAITECLNNLVSEEARTDKLRQVKERCEWQLRRLGFQSCEDAKSRLGGMLQDLSLLREAKAKGQSVNVVKDDAK